MELSWLSRAKITLVMVLGIAVFGFGFWPWFAPADPAGAVIFSLGIAKFLALALIAAILGFAGYYIGWPYGRQIGPLAVTAGICVLGLRSSTMYAILMHTVGAADRAKVYGTLWWEGLAWLALIGAGLFGVLAAEKLKKPEIVPLDGGPRRESIGNSALALVISCLLVYIFAGMFVRDVAYGDERLGSVIAQPANLQVNLGVMLAIGLAAYAVKYLLNANYLWPVLASVIVMAISMRLGMNNAKLSYITYYWPRVFYSHSILGILPVQMVGWGVLGAVVGYWLAVRTKYWQQTQAR